MHMNMNHCCTENRIVNGSCTRFTTSPPPPTPLTTKQSKKKTRVKQTRGGKCKKESEIYAANLRMFFSSISIKLDKVSQAFTWFSRRFDLSRPCQHSLLSLTGDGGGISVGKSLGDEDGEAACRRL